jgi:hypothetical protein
MLPSYVFYINYSLRNTTVCPWKLFTNTNYSLATEPIPSTIVNPSTLRGYNPKRMIEPVYQWDDRFHIFRQGPRKFTPKEAGNRMTMLRKDAKVLGGEVKVLRDEVKVLRNYLKTAEIKRKKAEKKIERITWRRVYNLRSRNKNYTFYK